MPGDHLLGYIPANMVVKNVRITFYLPQLGTRGGNEESHILSFGSSPWGWLTRDDLEKSDVFMRHLAIKRNFKSLFFYWTQTVQKTDPGWNFYHWHQLEKQSFRSVPERQSHFVTCQPASCDFGWSWTGLLSSVTITECVNFHRRKQSSEYQQNQEMPVKVKVTEALNF